MQDPLGPSQAERAWQRLTLFSHRLQMNKPYRTAFKADRTYTINVNLGVELGSQIAKISAENKLPMTQLVRLLLRKALSGRKKINYSISTTGEAPSA